jgi:micrococcal nuclease
MRPPYQYAAEAVRVIDGDTIDVILDFGFSLKQKMRLRLAGINTPELRSKDEAERVRAQEAKTFVEEQVFYMTRDSQTSPIITHKVPLVVKTIKTKAGKERQTFGRYVAEVYFEMDQDWVHLNRLLVEEGLAVESKG